MRFTYVCGHEENIRITSKAHMEEMVAFSKENKCTACMKLDIAAEPRKSELVLPKLTGTEKQVAWANQIRQKVIENKETILPMMQQIAQERIAHYPTYIMNMLDKFIESESDAAIWIDVFKPVTSQFNNKPVYTNILGGMAQRPDVFGLDVDDSLFLYDIGRQIH